MVHKNNIFLLSISIFIQKKQAHNVNSTLALQLANSNPAVEPTEVPMFLEPILRTDTWFLGFMLFLAFLLLAFVKQLEPRIFSINTRTIFAINTPESLQKIDVRANSTAFILLLFHFIISLWVCSSLFLQEFEEVTHTFKYSFGQTLSPTKFIGVVIVINLFLIIYNFLGLLFVKFITGEKKLLDIFLTQSWIHLISFGIIFFLIGLIWLLNPNLKDFLTYVFPYTLLTFFILRFIKLLIASIMEGVPWYYLILYLCTLEILPIVVIYHYIK